MSFADDIRRINLKIESRLLNVVKISVKLLMDSIITRTPVKTGQARSNYMIAEFRDTSTTKDISLSGDSSRKRIESFDVSKTSTFFITNNISYIRRLEYDSWSSQAPAGMVRISCVLWPEFVNAAVNQVGVS